jgi:hypothetical protein
MPPLNVPTAEELAELKRLFEAATPPPWEAYEYLGSQGHECIGVCGPLLMCASVNRKQGTPDAECIAAAHNSLPKLLTAATRLAEVEGKLQRVREILAVELERLDDKLMQRVVGWHPDSEFRICITNAEGRELNEVLKEKR